MKATLISLLHLISFIGKAQVVIVDTFLVNPSSKLFFEQNLLVQKIGFTFNNGGSKYFQIYKKGIWQDTTYNFSQPNDYETYDLDFIGDNYFFHKTSEYCHLLKKRLLL